MQRIALRRIRRRSITFACCVCLSALPLLLSGCGTSVSRSGTEQLLASDAIDRTIAQVDFGLLAGRKVYFDSKYITMVKEVGFVNAPYIISSLRQQLSAAGCKLQDSPETADYVVEGRVGALGTDHHDVTYGLPASNALNAAASMLSSVPALPAIPELSLANRNDQFASAKLALFAYHRESRVPIWQSGIAVARSSAKDTWVLGAGPIQRGTIYDGVQFAGTKLRLPFMKGRSRNSDQPIDYAQAHQFTHPADLEMELAEAKAKAEAAKAGEAAVQQAGHTEPGQATSSDSPKPQP